MDRSCLTRFVFVATLVAATASCRTNVVVSQPALDRELAAALEGRRLDGVAAHTIRLRDGVLREATDLGRIDRPARADAARRAIADAREALASVHRGRLDRDGEVDADLVAFLLDGAEDRLRLADLEEPRHAELARPAGAAEPLARPGPPTRADLALLESADAFAIVGAPAPATAFEARAAARRLAHAAELLRRRGMEASVIFGGAADEARKRSAASADALEKEGKRLDESAKSLPGEGEGFAPAAGVERFRSILRFEHGLDETPEEIESYGLALLEETERALEDLAAARFPGLTWREAIEKVRDDHATAEELPREARAAAEAARDFCIERGIVTIPPAARVGHVDLVGEEMAKSYPFAAYSFRLQTPEGESGRYMVSAGATWMDAATREERLRGNCRAWTRVVAAHEMWPGHHLQFWVADNECSVLRREALTPMFVEGWGLYCEDTLLRHGWFGSPADHLAVLVMRAWRACRVVLDPRLHTGKCTPEEAVDFLVARAATTRDSARAEVRRWMTAPGQPLCYAVGRREVLRLRAEEEARLGQRFDERAFHDRLLRCGPIPFRFVRQLFAGD
ncbi:MAG TPA: DUF885 domain-containing protein [Planctomycetota bacterium]|nr:DUF885 domain-containing protein [Planctomycetota bacterium]